MRNLSIILVLVVIGLLGFIGYGYFIYEEAQEETASVRRELALAESLKEDYQNEIAELEENLIEAEGENNRLSSELEEEKNKVDNLADQVKDITGTVGTLEKLSKTDKELLQKYSKVYFLNEHYQPSGLSKIDDDFIYDKSRKYEIHAKVWPHLEDMLEDAEDDDINLRVVSAFRSFGEQSQLKASYAVTYGSGANTFSADQGYSEHQLGTTVDFTSTETNSVLANFDQTKAYKWLSDNAYKYGFVLSYPKNNAYYQFEPWHWRYVGEKLAEELDDKNEYFYDISQRKIDEYLVNIFD